MSTPLQSVPINRLLSSQDPRVPPYSPTLINLNNRYNMSASSLTEALLLLSGMYISLVQPEPGPIKIGLHAVFPRTTASFRNAITDPFSDRNKFRTFYNYGAISAVFDISSNYTRSEYAPKELLDMLCDVVFPKNSITIFYLNNHIGLQQYPPPAVRYLPRVLESLGLPIISYDTQFSPNAQPALSIQLAPTMGQMMDVMFAFLKTFNWTDFSFMCTLSYGCLDEITSIRTKINQFHYKSNTNVYGVGSYSFKLLSYVNFTDGRRKDDVREKLKYELHKDSRINLVHGSGAEVKTIMDVARELGLTGQEYVWIFTGASVTISQENSIIDESYPLGSFIIGYDSSRDDMEDVVKAGVNLWLQALNSLVTSSEFESIDFKTGFSCDRIKDTMTPNKNNVTRSPLFWKYGEIVYKYILKSKLPGDLKFDSDGILEANKFWILNVQGEDYYDYYGDGYDRRTSRRRHVFSAAETERPNYSDDHLLFKRSADPELTSPIHSRMDTQINVSPASWKNSKLSIHRNKDSKFFPENQDSYFAPKLSSKFANPSSKFTKSTSKFVNPSSKFAKSTSKFVNPSSKFTKSTSKFANPSSKFANPSSKFANPSSKFTRQSRSLPSRDIYSEIYRLTPGHIPSTITNITASTSTSVVRSSSVPASIDKTSTTPVSVDASSRLSFYTGKYSGIFPPDARSVSSASRKVGTVTLTTTNISSGKITQVSAFESANSTTSSPSRSKSPDGVELHFNLVTNITNYSSHAGTPSLFYLRGKNQLKFQPSPVIISQRNSKLDNEQKNRKLDNEQRNSKLDNEQRNSKPDNEQRNSKLDNEQRNSKLDNEQRKLIYEGNKSLVRSQFSIDHSKTGNNGNDIEHTNRHSTHNEQQVQDVSINGDLMKFQNRSPGRMSAGDIKDRFRRRVLRRQIVAKIADWNGHNLSMAGIVWAGGSSKPPKGKPEKYILKVVTWKEDPHVIYLERKNNTKDDLSVCPENALPCTVYLRNKYLQRTNMTKDMCCTGLCVDLLKRLADMLRFDVQLSEVPDGGYGRPLNKNLTDWNGMLGVLIHNEADMAIGALSITPERSMAVDFSVPFLQTGIAIIVAIREGVISPAAFLEPYDYPSWSLILVFSVHATGASIFIFEWLSPYGLNQGRTSSSVHKFSLFRSFWLIWAMLFGASVSTDQPKGIASRFLANIWALFAVVFCASYTANLAAFMITKDDFYDLSGIQDWRLKNPHYRQPPFKFATIANSSTDLNIEKNYKEIHRYMKSEPQTDVKDAIRNLKIGHIQAFIYDSTTLEYEVGKDDFCKLKTVGKRIAETGYGIAFPKRSQWVQEVNKALLRLQENGDIERLQKFWLAGACHKKKEQGISSHTLGILNFTSAFILLGAGVLLGVALLILEHLYFRFGRKSLKKWDKHGCCSLVSLSMGQSLTFEQSVMEAIDYHKHHKCKDPLCETQLWKIKYDLDIALLKISQLRKQLAYSASTEVTKAHDVPESVGNDTDTIPYQNGVARRRRQQATDTISANVDTFVNQPLLELEGGNIEAIDDDTSHPSSTYTFVQFSPHSTLSENIKRNSTVENNIPLQRIPHSYYETPDNNRHLNIASGEHLVDRPTRNLKNKNTSGGSSKTKINLNLHQSPYSSDEATSWNMSPSEEGISMSTTFPSLPPPSYVSHIQAQPTSQHQSCPQEDLQHHSDSNKSQLLQSLKDISLVSDIPDSSSSFQFCEESRKHLKSPCTISTFLKKSPSFAASKNSNSLGIELTTRSDTTRLLDGSHASSSLGYAGSHCNNIQSNVSISSDNRLIHSGERSNIKPERTISNLVSPTRGDDANVRQITNKMNNVYVNVDEIIGKETSF